MYEENRVVLPFAAELLLAPLACKLAVQVRGGDRVVSGTGKRIARSAFVVFASARAGKSGEDHQQRRYRGPIVRSRRTSPSRAVATASRIRLFPMMDSFSALLVAEAPQPQ